MTEDEQQVLAQVAIDEPWSLVERFAAMHRWRPEDVNAGVDELVGRLERLGVPVTVHAPKIYLSIPLDAAVQAGGRRLRAKPASMSQSVPGGVTAPLVYLAANPHNIRSYARSSKELFATDAPDGDWRQVVAGKIVVTEGFANPANTSLVEEWGAVAMIAINPGIDIHWGTCTTVWGSPGIDDLARRPRIPSIAVAKPDGALLIELARAGASATVTTALQEGWYVQKLPVVEISGSEEPEKFVFLHGHLDSWDVGVGDNATGDATMLEIARVLWRERRRLRRSVRIAWWPGHSTGRYAGSTWFADAFALDLDRNCVAQINCDSPGCRWATSYHQTTVMSEVQDFVFQAIRDVTGQEPKGKRPNQAGDYSFNNIGISSYFMLSSTMPDALRQEKNYYAVSGCGGNIAWHTENDTLEIADKATMITDIKIYLLCVYRNATARILPYDWRRTAAEFRATTARYQEAAGDRFDLAPVTAALDQLDAALARLQGDIEAGRMSDGQANRVLAELARVLVPLNFTRQPRFTHDPAYTAPPLPAISLALALDDHGGELLDFALTQLLRGRNQVVGGLLQACDLIATAGLVPAG